MLDENLSTEEQIALNDSRIQKILATQSRRLVDAEDLARLLGPLIANLERIVSSPEKQSTNARTKARQQTRDVCRRINSFFAINMHFKGLTNAVDVIQRSDRNEVAKLLSLLQRIQAENDKFLSQFPAKAPTAAASPVKPKNSRRKQHRALTGRQTEAMQLYGEHKGNMSLAAKIMGVSRATFKQHYQAATTKMGRLYSGKPKSQSLPTDHRGQNNVFEDRRRR